MITKRIEIGDRITWDHYGKPMSGTVVRTNRYPWCPGAGELMALSDENVQTTFPIVGGNWKRAEGREDLEAARERYTAYLSQYEAWRAHFANGIRAGSDWGAFEGFGRVA